MPVFLSKLLAPALSPIGVVCELLLVSILAMRSGPRLARVAAAAALLVLIIAGNSHFSALIAASLESRDVPRKPLPRAQAIVVLSADAEPPIPPQPTVLLDGATANRLLFAAQLYRLKMAPIVILSGGRVPWSKDRPPASQGMAEVINLLGVPQAAIIQEPDSADTFENAVDVKAILKARRLSSVLLVTSAMHMPRALALFKHQGIDAIPAPCDYAALTRPPARNWQEATLDLIPDAGSLQMTSMAVREYLGIAVYHAAGLL